MAKLASSILDDLSARAAHAVHSGYTLLILSDRGVDAEHAPIPSLLALSAVHNHLIREGTRNQVALIVESGEPREVMHFALLLGYGASAINPYLAIETLEDLHRSGAFPAETTWDKVFKSYMKSIDKGLLKTFSKMGISTLQSYQGAQVFEAIGLNKELIERYFTGTVSRIEGVGLDVLAQEAILKHRYAYAPLTDSDTELAVGCNYQFRTRGEYHLYNPDTIAKLQHAVRSESFQSFQEYTDLLDRQGRQLCTLRGLLEIKHGEPIPLEEVEPAKDIVKRFATGAMSYGSISKEAHETLAIAMNRIGAKSNTGEGGEDEARFGTERRSAIKQVASARFGVTANYLVNADELQIKMAQGAKPGEGGQLPGHKVDAAIARVRHSIPGVGLISPPPHHDIYSIEDLAQLIYDLKNVNPRARIAVKLVAEVGVGTVAAGVAKAHADVVLISGDSGGTGASPLSSIKHAGVPLELGLAEAHQVLVMNDLRGRIRVQTDGKLQTGRDVAIAALLGAEEFGFSTAPLVAMGCIMMRKCHLNTCPVGIATQDPVLRRRFEGTPENAINFFNAVAEEVRRYLASIGARSLNEVIGRTDYLEQREVPDHPKANLLDLSRLLAMPKIDDITPRFHTWERNDKLEDRTLDDVILQDAKSCLQTRHKLSLKYKVKNTFRSVGTQLSGEIAYRFGDEGLPENTLNLTLSGSAGQSLGAFLVKGVRITLVGESNDYVGKGMSGGEIILVPSPTAKFDPAKNSICGNTVLYGATGGALYLRGRAGERFAVRNSGAIAVVEGIGDHGCEYMTNGRIVVLGVTGKNFAAGMSGGVAYVLDQEGTFEQRCNKAMVSLQRLSDPAEVKGLKELIYKHLDLTESARAKEILAD